MQAVNGSKYKWMLYGDDDTLWFTGGVLDLLKDLDPDMPYVITGMTQSVALCCPAYAVLRWTGLCCAMRHCVDIRYPLLCHACCAVMCFEMLCCAVLCYATSLLRHLVLRVLGCAVLDWVSPDAINALSCCR